MWKQMRRGCGTKASEKKKKKEGATSSPALVMRTSRAAGEALCFAAGFALRPVSSSQIREIRQSGDNEEEKKKNPVRASWRLSGRGRSHLCSPPAPPPG